MRLALLLVMVVLAIVGMGARPPAKVASVPSTDDTYVVVDTSDKKRFSLSEDGRRIRAAQAHSVSVDLALPP